MTYDYVFALSSAPVPRLVERIHTTVAEGNRVAVAYLQRPGPSVAIGEIKGADVFPIDVAFRRAGIDRVFAFPRIVRHLNSKILCRTKRNACVYIDSLDLLAAIQIMRKKDHFSVRYEVRDLHRHQLSSGLTGRFIRFSDRQFMKGVNRLIVTSNAYFEKYYKTFYSGPVTLLENYPDPKVWETFKPKPVDPNGPVVIGLVGAIRYTDCIFALIEGSRIARARGTEVRLKIIGPDLEGRLKIDPEDDWIQRSGPFDYVEQIKNLYSDVDLIWSVYDTRIENVRLALSNKFYESLLSGIPVIAATNTHLGERIDEIGAGTSVNGLSAESIAQLLNSVHTDDWFGRARQALSKLRKELSSRMENHRLAEREALFD